MFLNLILSTLFPSRCQICKTTTHRFKDSPICSHCWRLVKRYCGYACKICGMPTISENTGICGDCFKNPPFFSRVLYYGLFDGVLKESIHLLKFGNIKRLANPLARFLIEMPLPLSIDLIIPVPLYKKNLRQRGFNQTAVIAYYVSKKLKIPLALDCLKKIKQTQSQVEVKDKEKRLKNLKGAFIVSKDINNKTILLVDDVITTGATIRECSRTLKKENAKEIFVIALAHSTPKQNL